MEDFYPPVLAVALVEGELSWTSAQTHAELKKQQDTFLKNELGKGKDLGVRREECKEPRNDSEVQTKEAPVAQPSCPAGVQMVVCLAHNPGIPRLPDSYFRPTKGPQRLWISLSVLISSVVCAGCCPYPVPREAHRRGSVHNVGGDILSLMIKYHVKEKYWRFGVLSKATSS